MRGVDVGLFQFDFDLTWAAFFLNAEDQIYGRFGGRDAESPDKFLTLAGLKHAMRENLALHQQTLKGKTTPGVRDTPKLAEEFPTAKRIKQTECIHCHQVLGFQRDDLKSAKKWSLDAMWQLLPPQPESLGLKLDPDRSNRILGVVKGSPAETAGLKAGSILRTIGKTSTFSFADVQYALHLAGNAEEVTLKREQDGKLDEVVLKLPAGWRKSEITWRPFMWGLEPAAGVYGKDLSVEEKKKLGLSEKALAFYQGDFVPPTAREAGIQKRDIILGIDNKQMEMTMLEFNTHIRLNYKLGDRITYNVIRDGKKIDIPMKLAGR